MSTQARKMTTRLLWSSIPPRLPSSSLSKHFHSFSTLPLPFPFNFTRSPPPLLHSPSTTILRSLSTSTSTSLSPPLNATPNDEKKELETIDSPPEEVSKVTEKIKLGEIRRLVELARPERKRIGIAVGLVRSSSKSGKDLVPNANQHSVAGHLVVHLSLYSVHDWEGYRLV